MGISLDTIDYAFHSIQIKDAAGDALAINVDGSLNFTDNGGSITVDAADLDIRDLNSATDSVAAVQSGTWTIDSITNAVTVQATNLDVRDLSHTQDSVKIGDGTDFLAVAADGSIAVTDNGTTLSIDDGGGSITVDGSVSVSGSVTVSSTDLDIRDLVYTQDSVTAYQGGSWSLTTVPDAYDVWKATAETVTNAATQVLATPLTSRLNLIIQNIGDKDIFIGQTSGVTVATGLKVPKGGSLEIAFGAGAAIYALTASGTSDVRFAEFAA